MEVPKRIPVTFWRRAAQAAFLLLFLFLFRQTDYHGTDEIGYAVNVFFRWDPLIAASAMLAAKAVLVLLLPALVVVALTLVLGRFFCGWVCPLGTLLDLAHYVIPPGHRGRAAATSRSSMSFWVLSWSARSLACPWSGTLTRSPYWSVA